MRRHNILGPLFLAATTLALSCGGDDGSGPPPPEPPVVGGVSATTVSPGDTLIITGSHFAATAGENTVTFTNPVSGTKPFQATETELRVVVDQDATDGPFTVATSGGSDQGQSLTVTRGVGDYFVFGGRGPNQLLSLPNPAATTRYLVIPHGTNSGLSVLGDHDYAIESSSALPALAVQTARRPPHAGHAGPREVFEARRWAGAVDDVARYGVPRGEFDRAPALTAQVPTRFRQFLVLNTTDSSRQNLASSYTLITAELRYPADINDTSTKCYVYADVDTLPTGNFTQAHFTMYGQAYDNSIEDTNVGYFGSFSDVDGNDRVILLVTPVVNRMEEPGCTGCSCGFIAGFFNPRDLYTSPPVPAGTTNHAEILYLLAADPTGVWDCVFLADSTAAENLGTIPHEHQHLISFSHRLFHENGVFQQTWLEEGMAHMAEDLNGDNSSNIGRGKLYREDPGAVSIEDNAAGLEQRGGIYLMMRLLADRYGTDILKAIVQSNCTGRACIQNVTGKGFYDVLAEFLAAQYLSGTGITSDDRFNYASIDITDFGPLLVHVRAAGGPAVNDFVRRSGGDFYVFTGLNGQNSVFKFTDPDNVGLRDVILRVQ